MTSHIHGTKALVAVSAVLHFLVDGLCVCCLYQVVRPAVWVDIVPVFLTYNILAFLSQPLTGWVADVLHNRHWLLVASVSLLSLGVMVAVSGAVGLFAVATLLGVGNSLFHVWGGKEVAVVTGNDIRALGVFVSTGAFGLTVGMVFASWWLLFAMLLSIALLALLVGVQEFRSVGVQKCGSAGVREFLRPCGSKRPEVERRSAGVCVGIIVALMAFVMLRSWVGETFSSGVLESWSSGVLESGVLESEVLESEVLESWSSGVLLLVGFVAMLGKMAGGWIARGMGSVRAFVFLIVIVAGCYLGVQEFGSPRVWFLAGLLLVNCTMPITLYWANVVMPGREGLAFGLLAAALMPGYVLANI